MKEGMATPPIDQPDLDETDESRRFRKLDGIDYKRGAIDYAQKLAPSDRHHLLTKPFYNLAHRHSEKYEGEGPDADTHRHFSDFANMAVALALPAGARILDVGCGAGWLCEYFARFGYHVTGIDISPSLIELARERLQRVPYRVDDETNLSYQFFVHDIEIAALPETFDAVICYDALHHFEDEDAVFANLRAMLNYGGLLFVLEGERPPAGSASAEELRGVMRQYQTLESPFSREYLLTLLRTHGFAVVGDYLGISGLFEREAFAAERITQEQAGFNYLLCKKVAAVGPASMPNSREPGELRAEINLEQELPQVIGRSARLEFYLIVKNTGDTLWLVDRYAPQGTVRLGIKLFDETNNLLEEVHGVPALPRPVAPGEQVRLKVTRIAPAMAGTYTLKIDLIDQEICWFEERGSEPWVITFVVGDESPKSKVQSPTSAI
jgi:2-polyprenyl-3-methyl-5-hydroxy-6-metoxy-1,4-benzoquinol methylase